jgi:murein DD-endopeptidase MepM/ murein hydrolase activator NlpD
MHEQGTAGMFEVLFQAENISDFFARWEYIRTITQFDRDLLSQLENAEERISTNVSNLQRSEILISDLQARNEQAIREMEQSIQEKNAFFVALEEDADRHAQLLDIMQEEAHAINIEFGVVQRIHREALAEAERKLREEEDARRAAAAAAAAEDRAANLSTLNPISTFQWPLAVKGTITSEFGNRPDPFTGRSANHEGIDVSAPAGTIIKASEAGFVRYAGWGVGYGNYIIIDHSEGYSTLYAHNSRNRVTKGQRITQGQHIADVGSTGRSTGNHVHFEIRKNGNLVNPLSYVRQ